MTVLIIKTKYDDHELDDDIEQVEVDGDTLLDKVATFNNIPVNELQELIKSGKWVGGGEWKTRKDKIVFDSDTTITVFSM